LQDLLGNQAEVTIAVGAALNDAPRAAYPEEIANTSVRWLDENGAVLSEEPSSTARLHRARGAFPRGAVSLELTTQFTPSVDGEWRLGASGHGHVEVAIGDAVVLADELGHETSVLEAMADPPTATVRCHLESGQTVDVVVRYRWRDDFFIFVAGLVVQEPRGTDDEEITRAVDLARSAEVAVVIVGTSETVESEGRDRADIRLPGRQDELVSAVAAANPRTIVVVNAGSPVEMPWRDDVAAVLVCWFPGMEFGTALAEVLLGEVEPGGRLPTSWPASLDDAPVTTTTPTDGRLHYDEGVHIGYRGYLRAGVDPAYWFGHGLGYTTWAYEHLAATSSSARVRIRNTGSRRGKEVVQIYTSWPDTTIDRPARVLSGYAVVVADPGETVEVDVAIEPRTLRYWDATTHSWQSESGSLVVQAGPSAGELPLAQPVRNREAG
jgi:beta-glucosidase